MTEAHRCEQLAQVIVQQYVAANQTLDLLVVTLTLYSNPNCLHLLTPLRMVWRHHSAQIRVLCHLLHYINLVVVVVIVVTSRSPVAGTP